MILENEAQIEAYIAGRLQHRRSEIRKLEAELREEEAILRAMVRVGYNTAPKQMPWMIGTKNPKENNAPAQQHSPTDIPPDAPHGFGIRQPIGEDSTAAALDQPRRGDSRPQPEDSRGDRRQPSNDQHSTNA